MGFNFLWHDALHNNFGDSEANIKDMECFGESWSIVVTVEIWRSLEYFIRNLFAILAI